MKQYMRISIGALLILVGLVLGWQNFANLFAGRATAVTNQTAYSKFRVYSQGAVDRSNTISGTPVHIDVPAANVSIDIIPGYYNAKNASWTLSNNKAMFATISSPANNQRGNTFIYGHDTTNIFGRLLKLTGNATAVVATDNHHTFTYQLVDQFDVKPSDTSVLRFNPDSAMLTLQTCSGSWYQNRHMMQFKLVKAV